MSRGHTAYSTGGILSVVGVGLGGSGNEGLSSPTLQGWGWLLCRWRTMCVVLSSLVLGMVALGAWNASEQLQLRGGTNVVMSAPEACIWSPGGPTLYYLRTKLGVNYDAGHWFHMSENLLTAHSILRASRQAQEKKMLASNGSIFLAFDAPGFVSGLNGVTRLLSLLGLVSEPFVDSKSSGPHSLALHFIQLLPSSAEWFPSSVSPKSKVKGGMLSGIGAAQDPGSVGVRDFFLSPALLADHQGMLLSEAVSTEQRFLPELMHSHSHAQGHDQTHGQHPTLSLGLPAPTQLVCTRFEAAVGGLWPTPQRGHWFPNPGDVEALRAKIAWLCPPPAEGFSATRRASAVTVNQAKDVAGTGAGTSLPSSTSSTGGSGSSTKRKLVIYQRDLSRRLDNEIEALELLGRALPADQWEVRVLMHAKDRSPCELAHALHDVDVLVTPHGFQSMLLLFLPRPSLLFEVFPFRYYKRGYGPLGKEYGVIHSGVMSPPLAWHSRLLLSVVPTAACMGDKQCRNYARGDNVRLTVHGVARLVKALSTRLASALAKVGGVKDDLYAPRAGTAGAGGEPFIQLFSTS